MRALCIVIFFSSCALVISQHQSSNKSPHPYTFGTNQRSRRLPGPSDHKRPSYTNYGVRSSPSSRKQQNKKNGVPSYAVQMEPLVQYSQPDPLYTIEKQYISDAKTSESTSNDLIKKNPGPMVADVTEGESISRAGQISHGRHRPQTHLSPPPGPRPNRRPNHHHHHHMQNVEFSSYGTYYEGPPEAFEPPEPIIEIIIKESNESLPAPPPLPTPPPPKKMKEPVQVFYVKYKKDPAGGYGGEEKIIYDAPIPAVTPPANNEESYEAHEEPATLAPEYLPEEATVPPQPSTTLKAIIRPDSETFDASGVHISFGGPEEASQNEPPQGEANYESQYAPQHEEQEQQSAPQPAIAFPSYTPRPTISRSSSGGTSILTKRTPAPFNGQQSQFQPNFPGPSAPPSFQQVPQFPPQDFQPPHLNPSRYSTLPQNLQFPRAQAAPPQLQPQPQPQSQSQPQPQPQSQPQRYTTINNPPPIPTQYHTINQAPSNQPPSNFPAFGQQPTQQFQQQRNPARPNPQDQHQQQVEQVNRLQQQQQLLQQQFGQQHRFQQQPFPQQTAQFQQQPSQPQFLPPQQFQQQSSLQHQSQPQSAPLSQNPFESQQQQQQQHQQQHQSQQQQFQRQQQFRQPPKLQYVPNGPEIVKSIEQPSNIQNHRHEGRTTFAPTPRPLPTTRTATTLQQFYRTTKSTTTEEPVTEVVTEDPKKIEKDKKRKEEQVKKNVANLPDEVPDDLREQLLSSGILGNADIQILDYDKIGDIPIESLPPEALANFQQAAGSQRVHVVRRPDSAEDRGDEDSELSSSEQRSVILKNSHDGDMEMKVVRFNPEEDKGVADRYMKQGATQLAPVVLNDNKYNRYLPLQVSGAQFPVPDVPELRGRNVTSVVVLAPVDYEFLNRRDEESDSTEGRVGRSAAPVLEVQGVHFVAGDVLKTLVRMPSTENYRRWLQKENSTSADKQSVVLLVVEPGPEHPDKEIFMYDIATGRVSKLRGELSSTFVQVAASNSHNRDLEEISDSTTASEGNFHHRSTKRQISRPSR